MPRATSRPANVTLTPSPPVGFAPGPASPYESTGPFSPLAQSANSRTCDFTGTSVAHTSSTMPKGFEQRHAALPSSILTQTRSPPVGFAPGPASPYESTGLCSPLAQSIISPGAFFGGAALPSSVGPAVSGQWEEEDGDGGAAHYLLFEASCEAQVMQYDAERRKANELHLAELLHQQQSHEDDLMRDQMSFLVEDTGLGKTLHCIALQLGAEGAGRGRREPPGSRGSLFVPQGLPDLADGSRTALVPAAQASAEAYIPSTVANRSTSEAVADETVSGRQHRTSFHS